MLIKDYIETMKENNPPVTPQIEKIVAFCKKIGYKKILVKMSDDTKYDVYLITEDYGFLKILFILYGNNMQDIVYHTENGSWLKKLIYRMVDYVKTI